MSAALETPVPANNETDPEPTLAQWREIEAGALDATDWEAAGKALTEIIKLTKDLQQ